MFRVIYHRLSKCFCGAFIISNWYARYTIKTINKIHFIDFYVYLLRSITCFAHFVRSNDKVELIWPVLRVSSVTLQWASDAQIKYCWGHFTVVCYYFMFTNPSMERKLSLCSLTKPCCKIMKCNKDFFA